MSYGGAPLVEEEVGSALALEHCSLLDNMDALVVGSDPPDAFLSGGGPLDGLGQEALVRHVVPGVGRHTHVLHHGRQPVLHLLAALVNVAADCLVEAELKGEADGGGVEDFEAELREGYPAQVDAEHLGHPYHLLRLRDGLLDEVDLEL